MTEGKISVIFVNRFNNFVIFITQKGNLKINRLEDIMQKKSAKIARRAAAGAVSAVLLFSSMNMELLAKDASGLPSAGIDFILSSDATSVKSLKDEDKGSSQSATPSPTPNQEAEADALASALPTATAAQTPDVVVNVEEVVEEKVIEETMTASTTKTVPQKERELEAKKEEEGFKSLVIAKVNDYVNIRSIPSEEGEILGKLYDKSVGEFIEEEDGWYKITSGSVTGYVKAEYCVTGEDAVDLAKKVGTRIATVTTTTLKVREEPSLDAITLGLVPIGDELIVTEELDGWVKVNIEEGDGYVSLDYVTLSTEFVKAESKAEEEARLAKEEAERKAAQEAAAKAAAQRAASNQSTSGSESASQVVYATGSGSELGKSVASFACQFVGNPYVWGGTSLTEGADCSGFVMSVYNNFGVSLPHSSSADRSVGSAVNGLENAQPGDIICYSGHVAIYIGNGQIVHASTAKTGIIISNATYRSILSIRRIF